MERVDQGAAVTLKMGEREESRSGEVGGGGRGKCERERGGDGVL